MILAFRGIDGAPGMERDEASTDGTALESAGLEKPLLAALRPGGVRERLRVGLGGGYTALQVYARLDPALQERLGGGEPDAVRASRGAVEHIRRALEGLVATGRARRATRTMTVALGSKGPRDVVVDVFRLA